MADLKIKLTYFGMPGRAEVSRLVLVAAGIEFEDERLSRPKWQEIKPSTPFGTCPILELNGKQYGQSKAISAFLARTYGFYGDTLIDMLNIDQVAQLLDDFGQEFGKNIFYVQEESKRAEGERLLKEEIGPKFLGFLEKIVQENGTDHAVGNKLTLADIYIFDLFTGFFSPYVVDSKHRFPLLAALVQKVAQNERIKAYMDTRDDRPVVN